MTIRKLLLLLITHGAALGIGFGAGIYALPIIIAPPAPTLEQVSQAATQATYTAQFVRDLPGSDRLHWGEGEVSIAPTAIALSGKLAPGPDYKLYLAKEFVDTEAAFAAARPAMAYVGDIKTFNNFVVDVPGGVNPSEFNTVVVWCETFGEFITAAKYK